MIFFDIVLRYVLVATSSARGVMRLFFQEKKTFIRLGVVATSLARGKMRCSWEHPREIDF